MTYMALASMNTSGSLRQRIIAAAAEEGIPNPDTQVQAYMWRIIARAEWKARWTDALVNYTDVYNPDIGARPDVITDQMIKTAVLDVINSSG